MLEELLKYEQNAERVQTRVKHYVRIEKEKRKEYSGTAKDIEFRKTRKRALKTAAALFCAAAIGIGVWMYSRLINPSVLQDRLETEVVQTLATQPLDKQYEMKKESNACLEITRDSPYRQHQEWGERYDDGVTECRKKIDEMIAKAPNSAQIRWDAGATFENIALRAKREIAQPFYPNKNPYHPEDLGLNDFEFAIYRHIRWTAIGYYVESLKLSPDLERYNHLKNMIEEMCHNCRKRTEEGRGYDCFGEEGDMKRLRELYEEIRVKTDLPLQPPARQCTITTPCNASTNCVYTR